MLTWDLVFWGVIGLLLSVAGALFLGYLIGTNDRVLGDETEDMRAERRALRAQGQAEEEKASGSGEVGE